MIVIANTIPPPSRPPSRLLSDFCNLCQVRGCHIQSQIDLIDGPSVFDFDLSENTQRHLEIYRKPMIMIRGYENDILMFEYRAATNTTQYFFDADKSTRKMGNNASELIYGMVGSIESPYNPSDLPEVWSNRLANHNICVFNHE